MNTTVTLIGYRKNVSKLSLGFLEEGWDSECKINAFSIYDQGGIYDHAYAIHLDYLKMKNVHAAYPKMNFTILLDGDQYDEHHSLTEIRSWIAGGELSAELEFQRQQDQFKQMTKDRLEREQILSKKNSTINLLRLAEEHNLSKEVIQQIRKEISSE